HGMRRPRPDTTAQRRACWSLSVFAPNGDLAPVTTLTTGAVRRVQPFGHDRVTPRHRSLAGESAPIARDEVAETHGAAGADVGQNVFEVGATRGERPWPEIFVPATDDIERDEGRPVGDGNDDVVEDDGSLEPAGERRQSADDIGVSSRFVPAPLRPDAHA